MNIEIKYGSTIYNNNKMAKYVKYTFVTLGLLKEFWEARTEEDGDWKANLDNLHITHQTWIHSDEFFAESEEE
tara:strand:+ start:13776 stop:13994 length:219 start_codon:yes stop_codon:yes gene_type:complete